MSSESLTATSQKNATSRHSELAPRTTCRAHSRWRLLVLFGDLAVQFSALPVSDRMNVGFLQTRSRVQDQLHQQREIGCACRVMHDAHA